MFKVKVISFVLLIFDPVSKCFDNELKIFRLLLSVYLVGFVISCVVQLCVLGLAVITTTIPAAMATTTPCLKKRHRCCTLELQHTASDFFCRESILSNCLPEKLVISAFVISQQIKEVIANRREKLNRLMIAEHPQLLPAKNN